MINKFELRPGNKPTNEQSEGELFLTKLGLNKGVLVKFVKISSQQESGIEDGYSLEGILDEDVKIGKPIYFDKKSKNTSEIIGVREEKDKIFFKTRTSVYELVPPTENENIIKSEKLIEKEKNIETALKKAQDVALGNDEMKALFQKRISLQRQSTTPEVLNEILKLDKEVEKHRVVVDTLVEFKILMNKLGKNYYRVNSVVRHENAHANKASSIGAQHHGYSILVSKSKNGEGFSYQPLAHTKVPKDWPIHRQVETNIKIGFAPEEYGNYLSDTDEKQIEILMNELEDN